MVQLENYIKWTRTGRILVLWRRTWRLVRASQKSLNYQQLFIFFFLYFFFPKDTWRHIGSSHFWCTLLNYYNLCFCCSCHSLNVTAIMKNIPFCYYFTFVLILLCYLDPRHSWCSLPETEALPDLTEANKSWECE